MEKDNSIKIFTFIFIFILMGFIGFLFYQGQQDSEKKENIKTEVKSRFKK